MSVNGCTLYALRSGMPEFICCFILKQFFAETSSLNMKATLSFSALSCAATASSRIKAASARYAMLAIGDRQQIPEDARYKECNSFKTSTLLSSVCRLFVLD